MDDFGTGYSSLSYLQNFHFDKIKIDRSFVKGVADDAGSLNIVRAVTAMAKSLGMATTAEGVETAEQLEIVRAEGCTEMQGFLFSPAVPARIDRAAHRRAPLRHGREEAGDCCSGWPLSRCAQPPMIGKATTVNRNSPPDPSDRGDQAPRARPHRAQARPCWWWRTSRACGR